MGGTKRRWILPALGIVAFLVLGGPLLSLAGKTSEVQQNDSAAYLPNSAEATQAQNLLKKFTGKETMPAIVVYARAGGLTPDDRAKIAADVPAAVAHFGDKLAAPPAGPFPSQDGAASEFVIVFNGSDPQKLKTDIDWLRQQAQREPGLEAHVTGPGGVLADLLDVFKAIDGVLLVVTAAVILVILIVVYRSPILPFVVLGVAGVALGLANGVVYLLGKADLITLSGQTQGILDVLVLGAGTDYALLLVSRFREELRRHESRYDAMRIAWRASVAPIVASGGTVILGVLCLLVSDLAGNRGLGPVGAIGIACALVAMLALLPAILALLGRVAFWPFRPAYGSPPAEERGLWARVAHVVGRRPRLVWLLTVVVLGGFAVGLTRLDADGLARVDVTLTVPPDSPKAGELVQDVRRAVHAVAGADAKVGGYTAINLDVQLTAQRDRRVIIPLVLLVVFVVLMLLLRAVIAPLVLVASVVLSFAAALGVDYNIFLMTRVREEAARRGHRAGVLTGLAVTGGVITSAGVILASTFAALSVLPLVFLAELAFAVAFGVLLDTLVVRTLLVPALTVEIGRIGWWPGQLWRAAAVAPETGEPATERAAAGSR